jgi:Zn-dependent protease
MLQIFRVAGIPVRVDAGWLLVFVLIAWSLASGYFPHVRPELTSGAAWLHAVAAALLLFVSVLLHELSHALAARTQGVRVSSIRLHLFGGVSELESEPPTPRAEFLIAVVGPLASFALAALCYGTGRAGAGVPWLVALTGYLIVVNVIVGLFNLVPGFPLDGGRLLRAMLWWWSGRPGWATRWASGMGSLFALTLVVLGAFRAVAGELVGGLWFIVVGLFLHRAVRASAAMVRMYGRLESLRVVDVMRHRPGFDGEGIAAAPTWIGSGDVVTPESPAWLAFLRTASARGGRVAVVDGRRLVGTITHHDLERAAALERLRAGAANRAA